MTITIHAPAKLNLDLRIVGRRADGYHDLRTLFQSIELHDTVRLSARPGPLTVRSRTRALPRDRANLVWKAADVLWSDLGRRGPPRGVSVSITKAIPMAGGLGGGSSDAASALRGLCALWEVSFGKARLSELAASVGSDVPFFLTGGLVLGVGRGERLRPLPDLGRYWVVLAVPQFGVSSAHAYRWFDRDPTRSNTAPQPRGCPPLPRGWRGRLEALHNDLEGPVSDRHPEIRWMVERLTRAGAANAAMTGSGSTVYGLYRERSTAIASRRAVRMPGWRTLLTRMVGRTEFGGLVTATNA